MLRSDSSVRDITGVGPAKAAALERLNIFTVRDLLFHVPRAFEDRSTLRSLADGRDGQLSSFLLTVATEPRTARIRRDMSLTKFRVFDESGSVEVVFFRQDYLRDVFHIGDVFRFTGKLTEINRAYQLPSPKFERVTEGAPLPDYIPIYPLCEGITAAFLRKVIGVACKTVLPALQDYLPEDIRQKYAFPTLSTAILSLHDPASGDAIRAALRRLAFDDYFLFSLGLSLSKTQILSETAPPLTVRDDGNFLSRLPFTLTDAQARVCAEIAADLAKNVPMNRILVGDVGCGKTVCAAYALFLALASGHQAALMAPTEILARQHYADLAPLFSSMGFRVVLLTGSCTAKDKREIYAALSGETFDRADLVIGTHALLTEKTVFADLALTVTDEQHRFGVGQRAVLREKNRGVHSLVMSATPIPRTLALVLYGDLDVSRIDEMPKGRQRVETYVVDESYRQRLYAFIRKQVGLGGQVYVVCPAIEPTVTEEEDVREISLADLYATEKETVPALAGTTEVFTRMRDALPELRIDFLHGKMRPGEKDAAMRAFADGDTDVLVSTTVIEVGVNVPNASLMIVENAERFGLSQLHQLRGRVGRGKRQSYCILVSDAKGASAKARLETMRTTYDGYAVAEQDLLQRGPGDFIASADSDALRQSGGMDFRFAALCDESDLLTKAAEEAHLYAGNSQKQAQAPLLMQEAARRFKQNGTLIS